MSSAASHPSQPNPSRKCYIHPTVLETYLNGSLPAIPRSLSTYNNSASSPSLAADKTALMHLLQHQLAHAA